MTSEDKFGPELAKEINTIAHAHVLTMDVDDSEPKRFSYCSCDVSEGKLRILFRPDSLGTNIDHACQQDQLFPALNAAAPGDDKPMNFVVRTFIRANYDPKIAATQAKIGALVEKPDIKLVPNFEDTFAKLEAASKVKGNDVRDDWQENLGEFAIKYFEGLAWQMKNQKFEDDDMLREGFNEGVDKGEITFRIVDSLKYGSYAEVVIEDGVLYIQASFPQFFSHLAHPRLALYPLLIVSYSHSLDARQQVGYQCRLCCRKTAGSAVECNTWRVH